MLEENHNIIFSTFFTVNNLQVLTKNNLKSIKTPISSVISNTIILAKEISAED